MAWLTLGVLCLLCVWQAYFCVHGLAVLGELERLDKQQIIEWVYSLQVHPDKNDHCKT